MGVLIIGSLRHHFIRSLYGSHIGRRHTFNRPTVSLETYTLKPFQLSVLHLVTTKELCTLNKPCTPENFIFLSGFLYFINPYMDCFVHVFDIRFLMFHDQFFVYFAFWIYLLLRMTQGPYLLWCIIYTIKRGFTKYPHYVKDSVRVDRFIKQYFKYTFPYSGHSRLC